MPEPTLYKRLRDYVSGSSWVMPAFGIAVAAPVVGGILDKYNRKRAWESEMQRRSMLEQSSYNPLSSLRSPRIMEAGYLPELMRKASADVKESLDPVGDLGDQMDRSKGRKRKRGPKGYLIGFDQPYTGDDQPGRAKRQYLGGTVGGAGPNVMGGGY